MSRPENPRGVENALNVIAIMQQVWGSLIFVVLGKVA